MLSPDQVVAVLRELIAPYAFNRSALVIEDRTGLLGPDVGHEIGLLVVIAGQPWAVLAWGPFLQMRRWLWEHQPERVALIVPTDVPLTGLRDITAGATYVSAGGARLLQVLTGVRLPDDGRVDTLAALLLERPAGLERLREREITRAAIPRALLSALVDEDLLEVDSDAMALARLLRSQQTVPEAAYPVCREYAEGLSSPYHQLVVGLLTFGQSRWRVAQALVEVWTAYGEGQVFADPLVVAFLQHAAVNEITYLEIFATCIEQALLSEPEWGRKLVRQFPRRTISRYSRIYPASLEADLRRQVADLVAGRRTAVDDRTWREHLFYDEYLPWVSVASRLATLVQLVGEMKCLLDDQADLERLVQGYVERISAGDLAWMELGELVKQAVPLKDEIEIVRRGYQQIRTELNRRFAASYVAQYPRLLGAGPLLVHLLPQSVKPRLAAGEQVLVVIVDGLSYALWQHFRHDLIRGGWNIKDDYALALLPTVTAVSRYALLSGLVAEKVYPDLAEPDDEQPTPDERDAVAALFPGRRVAVYKKRELRSALDQVVDAICGREHDLVVVVINQVDEALRSVVETPFSLRLESYSFLGAVLDAAKHSHRSLLLTADHGFTPDGGTKWSMPVGAAVEENRLVKGTEAEGVPAVLLQNLGYGLAGPFLALYDFGGRFKTPPKVGYHGGVSLEEVVVPAAWLRVGVEQPALVVRFVEIPAQVVEDQEVLVTVEVMARQGIAAGVRVKVWLQGESPLEFAADLAAGRPFQRWQVSWYPTLPPREPVEPQIVRLRAICFLDRTEIGHAEVEVTIEPRPGKYESAVAALLP